MIRRGRVALVAAAIVVAAPAAARAASPLPATVANADDASVRAYRTLDRAFPALAAPAPTGSPAGAGDVVTAYVADNVARVEGPRGRRVVVSTRPLRTLAPDGTSAPVDLTLTPSRSGALRAPANAPFDLRIPTAPAAGFTLGPDAAHRVHVTPLATDPTVSAVDAGNQLLAAGTHPGVDTLLRPTATGLASFEQITAADAPETYRCQLDLTPEQTLAQTGGIVSVSQAGREILTIAAPVAVGADGTPVPLELSTSGRIVTMTVHHRAAGVVYPVLADPDGPPATTGPRRPASGPRAGTSTRSPTRRSTPPTS